MLRINHAIAFKMVLLALKLLIHEIITIIKLSNELITNKN